MGFLMIIRKWALRDKMPIREIARRTARIAQHDQEVFSGSFTLPSGRNEPIALIRCAKHHASLLLPRQKCTLDQQL